MHLMPMNALDCASIVGIDPGSETLGLSAIQFAPSTLQVLETTAATYTGSRLRSDERMVDNHSARFARLHSHYVNLRMTFEYTRPVIVVCESPFFNAKRPQAYGALVETLSAVRRALWEYDPYMQLYLIDPPRVKRAVGAAGNAGKDDMRTAVLKLAQELRYQGPVPLECIDEHSIDAIAVGYSKLVEFRTGV